MQKNQKALIQKFLQAIHNHATKLKVDKSEGVKRQKDVLYGF